jgi:hypothetical protein
MEENGMDSTEPIRRALVSAVNADPGSREALEAKHGQVWDTKELSRDFKVHGFMAPFIVATRKADGVKGSLMFQHLPRFYFLWTPDR